MFYFINKRNSSVFWLYLFWSLFSCWKTISILIIIYLTSLLSLDLLRLIWSGQVNHQHFRSIRCNSIDRLVGTTSFAINANALTFLTLKGLFGNLWFAAVRAFLIRQLISRSCGLMRETVNAREHYYQIILSEVKRHFHYHLQKVWRFIVFGKRTTDCTNEQCVEMGKCGRLNFEKIAK